MQLAFQLQHLLEEKAKLQQEKQRLAHENSNLAQLLEYATASIGGDDSGDAAWPPGAPPPPPPPPFCFPFLWSTSLLLTPLVENIL